MTKIKLTNQTNPNQTKIVISGIDGVMHEFCTKLQQCNSTELHTGLTDVKKTRSVCEPEKVDIMRPSAELKLADSSVRRLHVSANV